MYKADTVFSTAIFGGRRGISHTGCAQTRSKSRYFRVVRNPEKKGGTSCAECGASVGQLHPRRKQAAVTLLFFEQRTGKTIQPLRPQVEGEQRRIVLFQDEFHCLVPSKLPLRAPSAYDGRHK